MADTTKTININYRSNVETMTIKHRAFDSTLGKVTTTTERWQRALGKGQYALTGYRTQVRNATAGNQNLSGSFNILNKNVAGLALRFVGYNFIMNQVMGAQQKVVQWVQESITKYREFDKAIAEVSTILTEENLPAIHSITAGIEVLSKQYGKGATDLAGGAYDILSAAFDSEDAIRLLTISTQAAIAGLSDVSTSVDIFTSVLNAYGMTVNQSQEVSDIFFQTIRYGKLVFDDLASALGYITPIAAAANVPFEEIAAALSTVTRMGLHVDMASRGLALAIQNTISPTKQASEAAQKYEVDMSALALQIKGLGGFIADLNDAMDEHGANILPEMIRNMRSLRVMMALTSEEGIAGFTRDLDLMAKSTGATETAMSKMMKAAQTEADITAQSMEYLERRVGDAWHEVDIWWKKAQVWWGTLFSGGDADAAVQEIDDRIRSINQAYIDMLTTTQRISQFDPLADLMLNSEEKIDISKVVNFDAIQKYLDLESEVREQNNKTADSWEALKIAELELSSAKTGEERYFGLIRMSVDNVRELEDAVNELSIEYESNKSKSEDLATEQMALQNEFDYLANGVDTLSEKINTHKLNILQLQSALRDLSTEVAKSYTAMSGEQFEGKLLWEKEVTIRTTAFDRIQQYAAMAQKYGAEFITAYKNAFGEFDSGIEDAITTIYSYNSAIDEAKKVQLEYDKIIDESTNNIRRNNLEIMKIQLAGMMRRRGLTRNEERAIKKLNIKNLEERIASEEATVKAQLEIDEYALDEQKTLYEEASDAFTEYIDRQQFDLWRLKDIRDDEVRDMEATIAWKRELLSKYTEWHTEEHEALKDTINSYRALLASIDAAGLAEDYADLYGIDVITEAQLAAEKYKEFLEEDLKPFLENTDLTVDAGSSSGETGGDEGSSGGGGTTPSYQVASRKFTDLPGRNAGYDVTITSTSGKSKTTHFAEGFYAQAMLHYNNMAPGHTLGWQRGTYYVPETGPAVVHRGERIIPAGDSTKASMQSISIGNVTINVERLTDIKDIETFAAMLAAVKQTKFASKTGRSNYRLR